MYSKISLYWKFHNKNVQIRNDLHIKACFFFVSSHYLNLNYLLSLSLSFPLDFCLSSILPAMFRLFLNIFFRISFLSCSVYSPIGSSLSLFLPFPLSHYFSLLPFPSLSLSPSFLSFPPSVSLSLNYFLCRRSRCSSHTRTTPFVTRPHL